GVEDHELRQIGIEVALVAERRLDLRLVAEVDVELLEERPIDADAALELAISDDRVRGGGLVLDEQRKDVVLGPDEAFGSRFEEAWLLQLRAELLFREEAVGSREVVDPRGVENDAGREVDGEVAEPAEEVVVFPAREPVDLGLELVELDASAEPHLLQLARLDGNLQRHDARRRVRDVGGDAHCREDLEVEQSLAGVVDLLRRERLAFFDVDRPAERRFGNLLLSRAAVVRVEALDRDRAEARV